MRKYFVLKASIIVIAIMVITYSEIGVISAQELNTSWSAFRHDSLNTGRSILQGPENNNLKWSFKTGDSVDSSPVLDHNGTIYIGSQDKKFYAIKPDGKRKWSYDIGSKIFSTPAIDINNVIYICAWNGRLFALDLEGKPRWSAQIKGRVASSPAISA
ncbi:MAG: outer membrane protein assembly factor BamB family protein, partial [Planctomycetota bacterium]